MVIWVFFFFMGFGLLPRKSFSRFNLIFHELSFLKNQVIVKEAIFFRKHYTAAASSVNLIFKGIHELGWFLKRHVIVKERIFFYREYYSVSSSVMLLQDSDSSCSSGGESSLDNELVVVPGTKTRTRWRKGRKLFSVVVRVCKSLNWQVAREIRFKKAMKKYGSSQSIKAFRMIMHTFASAGMPLEVHALLREIVFYFQKSGFDLYRVFHLLHAPRNAMVSVFVADGLIRVFAAEKILDCAIDVVKQMRKIGLHPSVYSCNFLLKCLAEASRREHLQNLFEEMKSFESLPNVWTYTIMMNFYCTNHQKIDIEEATKILMEMQERKISPSAATYSAYIHGLCEVGDADIVLDFIRRLRDSNKPLNSYCYNAIIRRFCATGKVDKAVNVFKEMKSFGIMPDVYSYSILIDGFCKCKNVMKAIDLIMEMKANNIKPTIVSSSSLLNGFCKVRATDAIKLFYEQDFSRYKYDQIAYNILIRGFCLMGSYDKAYHYLRVMVQGGYLPDTMTCNFIVKWYSTAGCLTEALQLIDEMVDQGISPNWHTYNAVICQLCNNRKPERALEVIPVMLKRNAFNVATCGTLIFGFVKNSNLKKAWMWYEKIHKLGVDPDIITCTIVIDGLCKEGKVEKAYNLFREMRLNPDNIAYTSMIDGFCKIGYMNEAFKLFKELPERSSVVTCSCLIYGFCREGRMDKATVLLDEMRQQNVSPDVKTYSTMISGYKRLGQLDLAYEMFDAMIKEGVKPDDIIFKTLGLDTR